MASAQVFPFPTCNVGPMHHGHIILPLGVSTVEECKTSTTQFLLSHGATFFCPHTWDIKLLASVADDAARNALCTSYYNALAAKESPIHLFRPTLAQGGLPAEVREHNYVLVFGLAVLRACVFVCTFVPHPLGHWVTGSLGTGTKGTFVRIYPSNSLTPPLPLLFITIGSRPAHLVGEPRHLPHQLLWHKQCRWS